MPRLTRLATIRSSAWGTVSLVSRSRMRHLRNVLLLLAWLGTVGLLHYELVHKAPRTPLGALPGSELAARTEAKVRFRALTGVMPIDRVLHEGQEAYRFYRGLATGGLH